MRKEVLYAIIGGILLGLVVAFGVWRINAKIASNNKGGVTIGPTFTPSPSILDEFKIVLDKPENNDVVTNNLVEISGITKPVTWVIISAENSDYIIQTNSDGAFNQEVDLIPGINQIKISAFDSTKKQSTTSVIVVYSQAFIEKGTESDNLATNSSEIDQKVAENLSKTINRPKAYIGIVTDITGSGIEIKTTPGEIQQISTLDTSTNVTNSTGTTSKQVKTSDIAIGDFIAAMGYVDANSVLTAQRVLITNPLVPVKITGTQAKVTAITKKTLTVEKILDSKEEVLQPDTKTAIEKYQDNSSSPIKLSSISKEDKIIYVEKENEKSTVSIRSIFVIPQN